MANYTWVTGVDAVTGNTLSFNMAHVAVIRQVSPQTVGLVLPCGLQYEIEGTRDEVMDALVKQSLATPTPEPRREP